MKTILKILVFLGCVISYGQTTVSGKITDDTGMPLPGANIKVVGTSLGTISDFDGNYTLTVDLAPLFR